MRTADRGHALVDGHLTAFNQQVTKGGRNAGRSRGQDKAIDPARMADRYDLGEHSAERNADDGEWRLDALGHTLDDRAGEQGVVW